MRNHNLDGPASSHSAAHNSNVALYVNKYFLFQAMDFPFMPFGCFGGMVSILNTQRLLIFDMSLSSFSN